MNKFKCPHCRQKLGNYIYAVECPFCHKELEHNRTPTGLADEALSHTGFSIGLGTVLGIACVLLHAAGIPVPGLGEPSSLGGYALRFLGAGLLGALVGGTPVSVCR